jgi:hypothetical protein
MKTGFKKNTASTFYIDTPETSWAVFTYSSNGDLVLASDWGTYTCRWRAFGDDFEQFLTGLTSEYFVGKLSIPDANQQKTHSKQKEILTILVDNFMEALRNQKPEPFQPKNTIEIKGELIDIHNDYES